MKETIDGLKKIVDKNVLIAIAVLVAAIGGGYTQGIIPQFQTMLQKKDQIMSMQAEILALQQQADTAQKELAAQRRTEEFKAKNQTVDVDVYKSPYEGQDIENASVDLVDQFVRIIRKTKNKVQEVSFTTSAPVGDQMTIANGILSLSLTLECNYASLQNFLNALYGWKYLTSVKEISLSPVVAGGDPDKLTAKIVVDLYVKTQDDPNAQPAGTNGNPTLQGGPMGPMMGGAPPPM